jgi:hypothetical protein
MTTKTIYVAGPMRGYPKFNFPAFDAVTAALQEQGHTVFSPAENDRKKHGTKLDEIDTGDIKAAESVGFSLREALQDDLTFICQKADCIVMLPGWEKSNGARCEHALAVALDIEIVYLPPATLAAMVMDADATQELADA